MLKKVGCIGLALSLGVTLPGCGLFDPTPPDPAYLYFLRVDGETVELWNISITWIDTNADGGVFRSDYLHVASFREAAPFSSVYTGSRTGTLSNFVGIDNTGNVFVACGGDPRRLTSSGTAAMPTLSSCDVAYLDGEEAFVIDKAGTTSLGPADAVQLLGNRVLLLFNGSLQLCSSTGTGCTGVSPPEGADLMTATLAPGSNHVLFRVPVGGRMQAVMATPDGSQVYQLTRLTDADVVLMQPFMLRTTPVVALTVRYGDDDYRIATAMVTTVGPSYYVVRAEGGWNTFALGLRPDSKP